MKAIKVTNIKSFMGILFSDTAFDSFLFVEGDISVAMDYHLSGRVNMNFFSEDELEQLRMEEFMRWQDVKENIRQIIKGRRLPVSMKLVLKKPGSGDITYIVNIRFDNNNLMLVTGVSHTVFTTDKSGEFEWDRNMCGFLDNHGIEYEEM
ncbi:MAG: hypothetical protein IK071_04895 [Lachnospiraceae bacterium]|nr:hypothetical protein [Lachnospiraceae bacterium]